MSIFVEGVHLYEYIEYIHTWQDLATDIGVAGTCLASTELLALEVNSLWSSS